MSAWAATIDVAQLTERQLAQAIDHTVLKPESTQAQGTTPSSF